MPDNADDVTRCLRALADGRDDDDAARAKRGIIKLGGRGTPEEARALLNTLRDPGDPERQQRVQAIRERMGTVQGRLPYRERRDLVLPLMTRTQATEALERRARAGDFDAQRGLDSVRARRR